MGYVVKKKSLLCFSAADVTLTTTLGELITVTLIGPSGVGNFLGTFCVDAETDLLFFSGVTNSFCAANCVAECNAFSTALSVFVVVPGSNEFVTKMSLI